MFAVVFIPIVIVARMVAFAHYLGDVLLGTSLAWIFSFIWGVFEPNWLDHVFQEDNISLTAFV